MEVNSIITNSESQPLFRTKTIVKLDICVIQYPYAIYHRINPKALGGKAYEYLCD